MVSGPVMVQIASDMRFDFRSFFFLKAVTYEQDRFDSGTASYTSDELPGLVGTYTFDSRATLWDGPGGVGTATRLYAYHGNGLSVNGNGFPNAGTVTGLVVSENGLGAYMVGASVSAALISAASQNSDSRDDDLAVLRAMLSGDDTARLSRFEDRLYAQRGDDTVYAGADDDLISGMQGGDRLYGEDGDDLLIGGYGFDLLNGGYGIDTLRGGEGMTL